MNSSGVKFFSPGRVDSSVYGSTLSVDKNLPVDNSFVSSESRAEVGWLRLCQGAGVISEVQALGLRAREGDEIAFRKLVGLATEGDRGATEVLILLATYEPLPKAQETVRNLNVSVYARNPDWSTLYVLESLLKVGNVNVKRVIPKINTDEIVKNIQSGDEDSWREVDGLRFLADNGHLRAGRLLRKMDISSLERGVRTLKGYTYAESVLEKLEQGGHKGAKKALQYDQWEIALLGEFVETLGFSEMASALLDKARRGDRKAEEKVRTLNPSKIWGTRTRFILADLRNFGNTQAGKTC